MGPVRDAWIRVGVPFPGNRRYLVVRSATRRCNRAQLLRPSRRGRFRLRMFAYLHRSFGLWCGGRWCAPYLPGARAVRAGSPRCARPIGGSAQQQQEEQGDGDPAVAVCPRRWAVHRPGHVLPHRIGRCGLSFAQHTCEVIVNGMLSVHLRGALVRKSVVAACVVLWPVGCGWYFPRNPPSRRSPRGHTLLSRTG